MGMQILVTGNMGYVGSCLVGHLRAEMPDSFLIGCDQGFYASCLTLCGEPLPEVFLNRQHYCDVRELPDDVLQGVDVLVHLAALSNDPIGSKYAEQTMAINRAATIALAKKAKQFGVKSFVFASSCSVYGVVGEGARSERSTVIPLTAYAESKVLAEGDLQALADESFLVSCLRFATACGMSPRLRLDLVLNDFVAGAVAAGRINILSDGSPWRPLIDVHDMALAIEWAIRRPLRLGGEYLVVNVGSNAANYQVRDLAAAVEKILPDIQLSINENAMPDKRSYKVDFSLFEKLAPGYQPRYDLNKSIRSIYNFLANTGFSDKSFRESALIRLSYLDGLVDSGKVTQDLYWQDRQ